MPVRILTRRGKLGFCSGCEATAAKAVIEQGANVPDEKEGEGGGEPSNTFASMHDCMIWASNKPEGHQRCCYLTESNAENVNETVGVDMVGTGDC